jgi:hypothetical protein
MQDYMGAMQGLQKTVGSDPAKWEIGGIHRQTDGRFKDSDLANLIFDAYADVLPIHSSVADEDRIVGPLILRRPLVLGIHLVY